MKIKRKYDASRLLFKILIVLILLACVAPFFIKGPGNRPLMTLDKLKLPKFSMPKLPEFKTAKIPPLSKEQKVAVPETLSSTVVSGAKKVKMYKWKDKDGLWHFSDRKNPDGPYQVFYLPANDKSEGPKGSGETIKKMIQKTLSKIPDKLPTVKMPETIPYGKTEQIKKEAQLLKKQLEDRYKEQERILKKAGQ